MLLKCWIAITSLSHGKENLEALRLHADADDNATLRPLLQKVIARVAIHAALGLEGYDAARIRSLTC